jgi:hypothetical protein
MSYTADPPPLRDPEAGGSWQPVRRGLLLQILGMLTTAICSALFVGLLGFILLITGGREDLRIFFQPNRWSALTPAGFAVVGGYLFLLFANFAAAVTGLVGKVFSGRTPRECGGGGLAYGSVACDLLFFLSCGCLGALPLLTQQNTPWNGRELATAVASATVVVLLGQGMVLLASTVLYLLFLQRVGRTLASQSLTAAIKSFVILLLVILGGTLLLAVTGGGVLAYIGTARNPVTETVIPAMMAIGVAVILVVPLVIFIAYLGLVIRARRSIARSLQSGSVAR